MIWMIYIICHKDLVMFDENLLYMFASRESAFTITPQKEDKARDAWNQLLDVKDVLECNSKLYGSPSSEELRGLYNQLTLIAKEFKNGDSTKENQSTKEIHSGSQGKN
tara:strand:+ start:100 stop:423 length:324 start_codon:yes stop_codon:yes gene_type:complete